MTVAELIDELQKYDQETPVGLLNGRDVHEVDRVYAWDFPKFGGRKEYICIEFRPRSPYT